MVPYAGPEFFLAVALLALLLLAFRRQIAAQSAYLPLLALATMASTVWIYGKTALRPLAFAAVAYALLRLAQKGAIPRWVAVVFTLAPLLLIKTLASGGWLMLGLSFATFRALDVLLYSRADERIGLAEYGAYLLCPLLLLAGPMYRWQAFRSDARRAADVLSVSACMASIEVVLLGVVQKFLVADAVDHYWLSLLPEKDFSAPIVVQTALAYSAFLYFDFAGYSNMAVGIGRMLGLNPPENFRNPVFAANPNDFWQRWHISLSQWLRDVVFMPVYKNLSRLAYFTRHRLFAQNLAIFATLMAMGTWNGLERRYVASGALFGAYSVIYNCVLHYSRSVPLVARLRANGIVSAGGRVVTILAAMFALYVFSGRSRI